MSMSEAELIDSMGGREAFDAAVKEARDAFERAVAEAERRIGKKYQGPKP